jgi:hypothetical protein
MEATKLESIPSKYCTAGHAGELVVEGAKLTPTCACGWVGHGIVIGRSAPPPSGFFRGLRTDALRELANHVGYDRSSHLKALDQAIAALQLAELNGGVASISAAHRVVDIQHELDSLAF